MTGDIVLSGLRRRHFGRALLVVVGLIPLTTATQGAAALTPHPTGTLLDVEVVGAPSTVVGSTTVTYEVRVTNPGPTSTVYDLEHALRFGAGTTIDDAAITVVPPGAVANPVWDGTGSPMVAGGVVLAAGEAHVWRLAAATTPGTSDPAAPAADCVLDGGETGTGLLASATLTVAGADVVEDACAPAFAPRVGKAATVSAGPDAGSTSVLRAGDTVDWVVTHEAGDVAASTTITDVIPDQLDYVEGSLEVPPGWTPEWSTDGGGLFAGTEPGAGVDALRASSPTGHSGTFRGGTEEFPAPPSQANQTGTGGDGYNAIPVGPRVYNIFHHQLARLFCTVKLDGAACYADARFLKDDPGAPLLATTETGVSHLLVSNRLWPYYDPTTEQLWVAGQVIVNSASTASGGWMCADLSVTPPAACAPTAFVQARADLPPTFGLSQGNLVDLDFDPVARRTYAGDELGQIWCLDVAAATLCPEAGWPLAPGFSGAATLPLDARFTGRLIPGTDQLLVKRTNTVTGADEVVCIDTGSAGFCPGWTGGQAVPNDAAGLTVHGTPFPLYDAGLTVTAVCAYLTDNTAGAGRTVGCVAIDGSGPVAAPAFLLGALPGDVNFEPGISMTGDWAFTEGRLFYPLVQIGTVDDAYACIDFTTQAPCGAPWPVNLPGNLFPYALTVDDQDPRCLWELGDAGALRPMNTIDGGTCQRSISQISVDPAAAYCATAPPPIAGWDAVRLTNLAAGDFGQATLTVRDANGDPVPGFDGLDVTADLQADGLVDLSAIPFAGDTTQLSIELDLDELVSAPFTAVPPPTLALDWDGGPVEFCFQAVVLDVCDTAEVVNAAVLAAALDTGGSVGQTAAYGMGYVAGAACVGFTKAVTGPAVPNGDGTWTIAYDVTVTNSSPAPTSYDLADELTFGDGVTVESATVASTSPPGIPTDPSWDGVASTTVATGVPLPGTGVHTWRVEAVAGVPLDLASAAADCTLDGDETGTGLRNVASGTVAGVAQSDTDCAGLPSFLVTKTVIAGPSAAGDGTWEIAYEIAVSNVGAVEGTYDLDDRLTFGAGIGVVSADVDNTVPGSLLITPGWDGLDDTNVVAGVLLAPGVTHRFEVEAVAAVPLSEAAPGAADCELGGAEVGTGLSNVAGVGSNGLTLEASACSPLPSLVVAKTVAEGFTPNGDGTFDVTYQLTVTNNGGAAGTYDLADTLETGPAASVVDASVTVEPATVSVNPFWDGVADTELATDETIDAGELHTYTVAVTYSVPAEVTSSAADCELGAGEELSGLGNSATLTSNDLSATAEVCDEIGNVSIVKEVVGEARTTGTDRFVVTYRLTVTSSADAPTTYDLMDTLLWGRGLVPETATVTNVNPGGLPADPTFDGVFQATIASNVAIGPEGSIGGTHEWLVTVTGRRTSDASASGDDCSLTAGEAGTGLLNEAGATTNGVTVTDDACVSAAGLGVIPGAAGTGASLPRTGASVGGLLLLALVLILFGSALEAVRPRPLFEAPAPRFHNLRMVRPLAVIRGSVGAIAGTPVHLFLSAPVAGRSRRADRATRRLHDRRRRGPSRGGLDPPS